MSIKISLHIYSKNLRQKENCPWIEVAEIYEDIYIEQCSQVEEIACNVEPFEPSPLDAIIN